MNKLLFLFYYYHYYLHLYQEIYYFLILCLNSSRVVPLNTHIDLFDLGLTSLSTFFSHITTVSGCGRELNAHF